jgi:hypothetical protein
VDQLVLASTLYGAATVVAALEAGVLERRSRRVLVVSNNTAIPELAPTVAEMPGFAALAGHFDQVVSYNETIAPYHPSIWQPAVEDATLLEAHLRDRWALGDGPVELVLESIQVPPALTLATIFADSPIAVYADGLMSYSPTRTRIGAQVGRRVRSIVHPDLVPALQPALLREYGTHSVAMDVGILRRVLDGMTGSIELSGVPPHAGHEHGLVLGQYLAALRVLSERQENELHRRMVKAAVTVGARSVWFKAHPSAPAAVNEALVTWAEREGIDVAVVPPAIPAEAVFAAAAPRFVVGCFSTALMTAVRLYGIPAGTVGTAELLRALKPYENSNRIPVTIADVVLPDLERAPSAPELPDLGRDRIAGELQPLVDAVAYCMQPTILPALHERAQDWLATHPGAPVERYFDRSRLTSLGLPGGAYVPGWRRLDPGSRIRLRRVIGQSRNLARSLSDSAKKVVRP